MKKAKWIFAIVALCMVAVFVFAGCDNAAAGESKPTGKDDGNPPPVSDDPRNAVLGTYNNVIIDGAEYTLTFYEGGFGIKKASSGNMRSVMPDVSDVGDYFIWSLSGDTVIIRFVSSPNSFTLDFSNSGGMKKLSNSQPVPAATYEWDEDTKTLTYKGPGEIKSTGKKNADVEKIIIQDGVTSLGRLAFHGCKSLASVIIPDSVTSLGYGVFANCTSLESVTVKATTPPKLGTSVIPDGELVFPDDTKIYVPSASVSAYKSAAGWSEYAGIIEPQ